jgi:large subunit ribosomal protein L18
MNLKNIRSKNKKSYRRYRIKYRIRKNLQGTAEQPRLSVYRSNKQIYAQLIDDLSGSTLASASSQLEGIADKSVNKTEKAKLVGQLIAERAKEAGIENVVFDRNGYLYHGRIKALAEGARENGLKF